MFRFTIRDVLWLMTLVAMTLGLGLGWWSSERKHRQLTEKYDEVKSHAGAYMALADLVHQAGYKIAVDGQERIWLIDPANKEIGPATKEYASNW